MFITYYNLQKKFRVNFRLNFISYITVHLVFKQILFINLITLALLFNNYFFTFCVASSKKIPEVSIKLNYKLTQVKLTLELSSLTLQLTHTHVLPFLSCYAEKT